MSGRVWLMTLLLIAACDPELERLSPKPSMLPQVTFTDPLAAPPPAPPPPPPPLHPAPRPPPDAVADYLLTHGRDGGLWQAFVYELASESGGPGPHFLRHRIMHRHEVAPDAAAELARRLGLYASFIDDDYMCMGHPVGYRLSRGTAHLDFLEDCGHFSLDDEDYHLVGVSEEMDEFLRGLRRAN